MIILYLKYLEDGWSTDAWGKAFTPSVCALPNECCWIVPGTIEDC